VSPTATASTFATGSPIRSDAPDSPMRRFFGVIARPQSYRNIAYLLLGLPLGIAWFTALVTVLSVSASMVVVALLGIPLLLGAWCLIRVFANVERGVANVLLDQNLPIVRLTFGPRGNVWVRLKAMTRERARWRELGYLLLRFPVGVTAFTAAATAFTAAVAVAYAPIHVRLDDEPFGEWFASSELERFASNSVWSWLLVPLGVVALFGAFHLSNALADACGRWAAASLDSRPARATLEPASA
jgi:hypothetical protein